LLLKSTFQVVDGYFVSPVLEFTVSCNKNIEAIHFERDPANVERGRIGVEKSDGAAGL
jgi:hypothetical protein